MSVIEKTAAEIQIIKGNMLQTVQEVIQRGETLQSLKAKTDNLNYGKTAYFLPLIMRRRQKRRRCIKFGCCVLFTTCIFVAILVH